MIKKPVILIIGTRPEGIKMLPIYFCLKMAHIPVLICSTTQHKQLLSDVFDLFNVNPDIELNIMQHGQDLFHVTTTILEKIKNIFVTIEPSLVLVQGDTTSTMAGALAAFYLNIPIGHVEAGLRTETIKRPFPEEMNRRFVSMISSFHYAPTALAIGNLLSENIDRNSIIHSGNTVVDMLRIMQEKIATRDIAIDHDIYSLVQECMINKKKLILLTAHRRESFNGGIANILTAMQKFAQQHDDVVIVYPYHPNPHVVQVIEQINIGATKNIIMFKPLLYKNLIYLLLNAEWVATDSGGIYEEAISIGKHVLILRNETERAEGIWEGLGHLAGTDSAVILDAMETLYNKDHATRKKNSVYGDGYAADKIVCHIDNYLNDQYQHMISVKPAKEIMR